LRRTIWRRFSPNPERKRRLLSGPIFTCGPAGGQALFFRPSFPPGRCSPCAGSNYALPPDGLIIRSRSGSEAVLECCALILRSRGFPPWSRCGPSDAVWHNPKLDLSLAVFTRLLSIHILRLLTGTCNGHEHRLPLRSSHASLLEPARTMGNLDAKNRNCTEESGRTSVDTESLSCGAALLWGVLDRDRATMAHQGSFDGGVMVTREFWSEFSRTVFRIRR
jgi:hypothetical protein